MSNPVNLTSSGPPETVLGPEPTEVLAARDAALALPQEQRRDAVAKVVAGYPTFLAGWADLGDMARDPIEAYAAYRVGYHRGLDRLRQSGWRGSGYVRWQHETNRGFLRAMAGLARVAGDIGEMDESLRCHEFLGMLDPAWPPADLNG